MNEKIVEPDFSGYYCKLRFHANRDDREYEVEGISQRDIVFDQLLKSPHVKDHQELIEDDVPVHLIRVRTFRLANLAMVYCPMTLRAVEYSGVHNTCEFMLDILQDLFPESRPYVAGHGIPQEKLVKRKGENRDVYLMRILRSWKSKKTVPQMELYLWRKWLQVIGLGAVGVMKRGAPQGRKRLATFTSEFTRKARFPAHGPKK